MPEIEKRSDLSRQGSWLSAGCQVWGDLRPSRGHELSALHMGTAPVSSGESASCEHISVLSGKKVAPQPSYHQQPEALTPGLFFSPVRVSPITLIALSVRKKKKKEFRGLEEFL